MFVKWTHFPSSVNSQGPVSAWPCGWGREVLGSTNSLLWSQFRAEWGTTSKSFCSLSQLLQQNLLGHEPHPRGSTLEGGHSGPLEAWALLFPPAKSRASAKPSSSDKSLGLACGDGSLPARNEVFSDWEHRQIATSFHCENEWEPGDQQGKSHIEPCREMEEGN